MTSQPVPSGACRRDEELAAFRSATDGAAPPGCSTSILLNTGARTNAILALTRFQGRFERRLINLQPPERDETQKRNPVLPVTDALLPALQAAPGDVLVSWHGSRWTASRVPGGAPGAGRAALGLHPYSVRHALATELRARGVPEWECAGWLGHSTPTGPPRSTRIPPAYLLRRGRPSMRG